MGVGAGLYMYDVVVKKFTFAISSAGEFLVSFYSLRCPRIRCKFSVECPASRGGFLRQHGLLVLLTDEPSWYTALRHYLAILNSLY